MVHLSSVENARRMCEEQSGSGTDQTISKKKAENNVNKKVIQGLDITLLSSLRAFRYTNRLRSNIQWAYS